jgi:nicotinate-nucleotide--dimethylbenzimidazole phosphoribosyltransferase
MEPFDDIRALIGDLKPADDAASAASLKRLSQTMAPEALGSLEPIIGWIAGWRGAAILHRPIIALYAGAHAGAGDVAATRAQLEAIAAGAAPVSRAALHLGAGLEVFDLAIDRPVGDPRLGPAMSERECAATMAFGMEALAKQPDLLVLGGLGGGVNFAAAALACALSGEAPLGQTPVGEVAAAVERARGEAGDDPLRLLRQLGGRETAAICGAIVAAATQRVPVLLEGYPATAAAAVLYAVAPCAIAHCRVGQIGGEPGHRELAERLGLAPLFDFGITIADGTGSTAALSLIKLACALSPEATN